MVMSVKDLSVDDIPGQPIRGVDEGPLLSADLFCLFPYLKLADPKARHLLLSRVAKLRLASEYNGFLGQTIATLTLRGRKCNKTITTPMEYTLFCDFPFSRYFPGNKPISLLLPGHSPHSLPA